MHRILVFAKAPLPGEVKTRLARAIGATNAAALYRRLIEHCVSAALRADLGEVVLFVAPTTTEDAFLPTLAQRHDLRTCAQQGADIGARMAHALDWSLADAVPTLLIGSDCAALTPAYLRAAAAALATPCDVVLGPAEDGGYFLVGARRACPPIFGAVHWSTPSVLEQSRAGLRAAALSWRELAPIWDVDDAADLARLGQLADFQDWLISAEPNATIHTS
jgi:rSAM/selenodomain-associated transferase 1